YATERCVYDTAAHEAHLSYAPQRRANVAMLVSGVALIAALVLFLTPLLRRRRDQLRSERAADWPVDELTGAATATVGGPSEGTPEEPVATPEPEEATTGGRRGRTRRERRHRGLTAVLRARSGASRVLAEAPSSSARWPSPAS